MKRISKLTSISILVLIPIQQANAVFPFIPFFWGLGKAAAVKIGVMGAGLKIIALKGGALLAKGATMKGIVGTATIVAGVATVPDAIIATKELLKEENVSYPQTTFSQNRFEKGLTTSIEKSAPFYVKTCFNGIQQEAIPNEFKRCPFGDYPIHTRKEPLLYQESKEIKEG